ncbi:MAG: heavy-metal-associated domain-containing protein [Chloroflexi bacterium]|nr:heavy-metal-associated domain-containing protein [Chloroflexota bacterium]
MSVVTYRIPNISCEHCVHTITMELGDLEGVRSVQADAQTKITKIEYEPPATEEKIIELLKEINYPPEQ